MIFDIFKNQKKPVTKADPIMDRVKAIRERHRLEAPAVARDARRLEALEQTAKREDAETPSQRIERLLARGEQLASRLRSRVEEDLAQCEATEKKIQRLLGQALEVDGELAVNADEYMAELDQDDAQEVRDEEAWNRENQSPRRR